MTLYSWNVNGLRAALRKGFVDWFRQADADVVCLQETRMGDAQLPLELAALSGYTWHWSHARTRKGWSGVAIASRVPLTGVRELGVPPFDEEGRFLVAGLEDGTVLVNGYFPNGGRGGEHVSRKLQSYAAVLGQVHGLRLAGREAIVCGDLNTCHRPVDLARPANNKRTSGFLPEERAWLDHFEQSGLVDVFRRDEPDPDHYTWWSNRAGSRERNVGWRLDHFWVSEELAPRCRSWHEPHVLGSDHCPLALEIRPQ